MAETILITGANRGIGLALTQVALEAGEQVIAACRQPEQAEALEGLRQAHPARLTVVQLEVTDDASVAAAAKAVAAVTPAVDVLVNNAGISPPSYHKRLEGVPLAEIEQAFAVNAVGPVRVTRALLGLLGNSPRPRVVNVSSGAGSIGRHSGPIGYAYCTSKAGLNMLTRILAFDLRERGVTVVALDPGWVRTDMGGPQATLAPAQSARDILNTLGTLTDEQSGTFVDRKGRPSSYAW